MTWPADLSGPLLVEPARAAELGEVWARLDRLEAAGQRLGAAGGEPRYQRRGTDAVIPVRGALTNRGALLDQYGATSYPALAAELRQAADEASVARIVLDVDSPGGTVAGLDAVDEALAYAKDKKPVLAAVTGAAMSAAYWIASQADEVALSRRAAVGSIGVFVVHADISRAMTDAGVDVTLIHSGAKKVDGNPFAPLPAGVRADLQARVDGLRFGFAKTVAAGRPGMTVEAALATEAAVFDAYDDRSDAQPAIAAGLADRIASLEEVLASIGSGMARAALINASPHAKAEPRLTAHLIDRTKLSAAAAIAVLAVSPGALAMAATHAHQPSTAGAEERGAAEARRLLGLARAGSSAPPPRQEAPPDPDRQAEAAADYIRRLYGKAPARSTGAAPPPAPQPQTAEDQAAAYLRSLIGADKFPRQG